MVDVVKRFSLHNQPKMLSRSPFRYNLDAWENVTECVEVKQAEEMFILSRDNDFRKKKRKLKILNSNKEDWSLLATETVMVVVVAKNNFTGDIGCHQLVVNVDDPLTIVLLQQLSSFSANFFDILRCIHDAILSAA